MITFAGTSLGDVNIHVQRLSDYVIPERDVTNVSIPGRSGDLLIDNGRYKNFTLDYSVYVLSRTDGVVSSLRAFAGKLADTFGSYQRFEDDKDPLVYGMAKFVGQNTWTNYDNVGGESKLTFNFKPYWRLKSGETAITIASQGATTTSSITNPTAFSSKPLLKVSGGHINSKTYTGNPVSLVNAYENYIGSVVVNGKTTQAGSGTPSPTNIRAITGVGSYDKSITFDGSSDESWGIITDHYQRENYALFYIYHVLSDGITASDNKVYTAKTNYLPVSSVSKTLFDTSFNGIAFMVGYGNAIYLYLRKANASTLQEFRTYLSNHPLTVWYQSTGYTTATTFYEVAEVTDSTGYHAYSIQTDSPLFDGDTADIVTGKVHRKYGLVTLTGNEYYVLNSAGVVISKPTSSTFYPVAGSGEQNSSHFSGLSMGTNGVIYFNNSYTDASTVQSLAQAQYAAGTPIQFLYPLATQTDTTVTGNTITNAQGNVSVSAENTMTLTTKDMDVDYGTLTIGGTTMTINTLVDYLYIDCDSMDVYRLTSENKNSCINLGKFCEIPAGTSTIYYDGGITSLEITPRWWTL